MYYEQNAYQKMYYYLFSAVEDAINALSESPVAHYPFIAEVIQNLISAQNTCEDIYVDSERQECDLMENADMPFSDRMDQLRKLSFADCEIEALNDEYLHQFTEENNFCGEDIDNL